MKALDILKQINSHYINDRTNGLLDLAIKELEELNNRRCESCTHFTIYKGEYGICKMGIDNRKLDLLHNSFCCNVFEIK